MATLLLAERRWNPQLLPLEPMGPQRPAKKTPAPEVPPSWAADVGPVWRAALELAGVAAGSVDGARLLQVALSGWLAQQGADIVGGPLSDVDQATLNLRSAAARVLYGERAEILCRALALIAVALRRS